MDAALETTQTLSLVATMWLAGIGLGLQVGLGDIARSLTRVRLVARTITLDVLLIPLAVWIAVRLLVTDDEFATGLLLVAFAAAGPLGLKLAHVMRADMAYAIGIVAVLELANLVLVPVWSGLLGLTNSVDATAEIVRTIALLVAAPLGLGMLIRRRWPADAEAVGGRSIQLASVGLLVVVSVVIVRGFETFIGAFGNGAAVASVAVIGFGLVAGWLLGGPHRPSRLTTSVVTACRANERRLPSLRPRSQIDREWLPASSRPGWPRSSCPRPWPTPSPGGCPGAT